MCHLVDKFQNKNENIFAGFRSFNSHITKQKLMNRYFLTANQSKITKFSRNFILWNTQNSHLASKIFSYENIVSRVSANFFYKNSNNLKVCIFLQKHAFSVKNRTSQTGLFLCKNAMINLILESPANTYTVIFGQNLPQIIE